MGTVDVGHSGKPTVRAPAATEVAAKQSIIGTEQQVPRNGGKAQQAGRQKEKDEQLTNGGAKHPQAQVRLKGVKPVQYGQVPGKADSLSNAVCQAIIGNDKGSAYALSNGMPAVQGCDVDDCNCCVCRCSVGGAQSYRNNNNESKVMCCATGRASTTQAATSRPAPARFLSVDTVKRLFADIQHHQQTDNTTVVAATRQLRFKDTVEYSDGSKGPINFGPRPRPRRLQSAGINPKVTDILWQCHQRMQPTSVAKMLAAHHPAALAARQAGGRRRPVPPRPCRPCRYAGAVRESMLRQARLQIPSPGQELSTAQLVYKEIGEMEAAKRQDNKPAVEVKDAKQWLHDRGLLPEGEKLTDSRLIRRYLVMNSVSFGKPVTEESDKLHFCRQLLHYEDKVAVEQSDIGRLPDSLAYTLKLTDVTPFAQQPICYPPHVERWLDLRLEEMERTGRIQKLGPEDEACMVTALVLAPEAQTGQAFRICQNVIPVNKRTPEHQHPLTDCRRVLSQLGKRPYASLLDLKAGYQNVPFDKESSKYAVFTTHRGRYRWLRMPFGLQNAPAHFQWVMEQIIHGPDQSGKPQDALECLILLDDVTIPADSVRQCLNNTIEVIKRLASAGAMINLKKSMICADEGRILGHHWASGGYFCTETKKLKALVELPDEQLSRMSRASLYGLLSYFRPYVHDFATRTEKLRKLLAADHEPWTEEHSQVLRGTVQCIMEALPVMNYDAMQPVRLQVGVGPAGLAGVLTQKDPQSGVHLPVASHCRTLDALEPMKSRLELELRAIHEVLAKLRHITQYCHKLEIQCTPEFHALYRLAPTTHPEILARLIDIRAYQPDLIQRQSTFPAELMIDTLEEWPTAQEQLTQQELEPESQVSQEVQRQLEQPARLPKHARFYAGKYYTVYFDGAKEKGKGGAGYVIYNHDGQEVIREGVALGPGKTNNEAEVSALKLAVERLDQLQQSGHLSERQLPVRIFGDSQLIVRFMQGIFKKPRKASIYLALERTREVLKHGRWRFTIRNIPRGYNTVADSMAGKAIHLEEGQHVNFTNGKVPEGQPHDDLMAPYQVGDAVRFGEACQVAAVLGQPSLMEEAGRPCKICNQLQGEHSMVICDRCCDCYHQECIADADQPQVHDGPWHCKACRGYITMHGYDDPYHDIGLVDYLWLGKLPAVHEEAERIKRTAQQYRPKGRELQVKRPPLPGQRSDCHWANVPNPSARRQIVVDTHCSLGHVGAPKLEEALKEVWWWPQMRQTVRQVISHCRGCQKDKVKPKPAKEQYHPSFRPERPGRAWAIDMAGPFPRDQEGNQYLIVAVDFMSKWVEATALPSKHAFRCADWFYSNIIARWGKPDFITTDNGTEWQAGFGQLVQSLGIRHKRITVGNSKANGQVERMIRTLKSVMRRGISHDQDTYWSDHLPAALLALRLAAAKSHGLPPYTVITGQRPVLPSDVTTQPSLPERELSLEEEEEYVRYMAQSIQDIHSRVRLKLSQKDLRQILKARKEEQRQQPVETIEVFQRGDYVLRRSKSIAGKLRDHTAGLYRVVGVTGQFQQRVLIQQVDQFGRKTPSRTPLTVHASQLVRYHHDVTEPNWTVVTQVEPGSQPAQPAAEQRLKQGAKRRRQG